MAVLKIKDSNDNLVKLSQDNLESVYANEYPKQITLFQNQSVNTGLQNCVLMFSASATNFSIYRCVIYDGNIKKNILGNEAEGISLTIEDGSIVITSNIHWAISVIVFGFQYA